MAFADTAKLVVDLSLKGNFSSQLKSSERALNGFSTKLDTTQSRAYRAGQQIGTGIKRGALLAAGALGFLASQVAFGARQLIELEDITARTNAVLKSTKGAAGQTGQSIRALAEKYESLNATIDDKVIQSGENVLLTFTKINKKAFEPALLASLNLSKAMGQDLQSSIVQVGKALNDPIRGITALRRVGVSFTKDQEKQIKALVKSGKLYEAQQVILHELGVEFGGVFEAGGKTTAGQFASIGDAVEDLQKALATALLPAVSKVARALDKFLRDPKTVASISKIGDQLGSLFTDQNIATGIKLLEGLFNAAVDAAPALINAAQVTGKVVGTAVAMFKSLPPELQGLLVAGLAVNKLTGGLVTNLAGGLISAVISSFKGMMNVNAAVVNVNGPVGGLGGGGGGGILPAAGAAGAVTTGVALVAITASVAASIAAAIDVHGKTHIDELQQAGLTKQEIAATLAANNPTEAQTILKRAGMTQKEAAAALKTAAAKLHTAGDGLESARGAIIEALDRKPPPNQHTPGDTQGGMEGARGSIGDRLFSDELKTIAKSTDIEGLRGGISDGLTTTTSTLGGDIETMRGDIAAGLVNTQGAVNTGSSMVSGATTSAGQNVAVTTASGASRIVAAVNAIPAPITYVDVNISATNVTRVTTQRRRKGPSSGSRDDDLRDYTAGGSHA